MVAEAKIVDVDSTQNISADIAEHKIRRDGEWQDMVQILESKRSVYFIRNRVLRHFAVTHDRDSA